MKWWNEQKRGQRTALVAAVCFMMPLAVTIPAASAQVFGNGQMRRQPANQGMSTKKKVVLLAGAALVYYLYRKHQAKRTASLQQGGSPGRMGTTNASRRMPQLYRSKNGGVYYRDQSGRPVWLTAPRRSVQVPYEEVQRYAPDYNRYRGRPAPMAPSGARSESFEQFDSSLLENSYGTSSGARSGSGGGGFAPGPRR